MANQTDQKRLGRMTAHVAYGRWVCDGCGHAMWAHNTVYRFGHGAECYCYNCARAKRHGSKTLVEMGMNGGASWVN